MQTIDKSKPVMVTGATGYVAGWLVKKLLDEGLTVHAMVRDPSNQQKLAHLDAIAASAPGSIKYFAADLLTAGAYDEGMQGCELVFHTASPFTLRIKDAQRDLVDPALQGTRNVLEAVLRTASVKRVVLTSSCAAIIGDALDCEAYPGGMGTEAQWNHSSTVDHEPYSYSKTVAEQEAWKMVAGQQRWDLVVINPSLVLGPGLNADATSESFKLFRQLGNGEMKSGVPNFSIGMIDVRDLAIAHYNAGFIPAANGRNIISAQNSDFLTLGKILRQHFGDAYPFPQKNLPKLLVWLIAPLVGLKRKMISRNVGYKWQVDNSKGKRELGLSYRPMEQTVIEFFQQMIDTGRVKAKG